MKKEDIKIDPKTPEEFYIMAIDDMSSKTIEEWFNVPYIQSRGAGYAVLCLDGGAWDRPTVKGFADSKDEAISFILKHY